MGITDGLRDQRVKTDKEKEDELVAKVEAVLCRKTHRDDLLEGTRVVVDFDEVIPSGTLGTVHANYRHASRDSLTVLMDPYTNSAGQKSARSVWHLNRFQVSHAKEQSR